jgi:hypothetical protein
MVTRCSSGVCHIATVYCHSVLVLGFDASLYSPDHRLLATAVTPPLPLLGEAEQGRWQTGITTGGAYIDKRAVEAAAPGLESAGQRTRNRGGAPAHARGHAPSISRTSVSPETFGRHALIRPLTTLTTTRRGSREPLCAVHASSLG